MINDIQSAFLDLLPYMVMIFAGGIITFIVLAIFAKKVVFTHKLGKSGQLFLELSNKQILGGALIISRFVFIFAELWVSVATNISIMITLVAFAVAIGILTKKGNYMVPDAILSVVVLGIILVANTLDGYMTGGVLLGTGLEVIYYLQLIFGTLFALLGSILSMYAIYRLKNKEPIETSKSNKKDPEAETNADPDPDADTEAETNTDPEADLAADAETNADPEANADTEADTETETNTDADAETNADPEANADTEADTETETNTNADLEADTEAETNPDADADTEADTEAETNTDTDTDTDPDADTEAETNADTEPSPGSKKSKKSKLKFGLKQKKSKKEQ